VKCDRCGSERVMSISTKCSDRFTAQYGSFDYDGYAIEGIGIDDGEDYVAFDFCLECGQIQGTWPKPEPKVDWKEA